MSIASNIDGVSSPMLGDGGVFYAALLILIVAGLYAAYTGRQKQVFWLVFATTLWAIAWRDFMVTHDGLHHIYRIVELSSQVRRGGLDLLVQNDLTRETLPVFVYYSIVPYVPAVILDLLGAPPEVAFKLSLILYFCVMALGVSSLVEALGDKKTQNGYAFGAMLLASNYIIGDWIVRAAYAEAVVYAIVPWVTAALCRRKTRVGWLAFLIAIQMTAHPVVVLHAMIAQTLPALLLSRAPRLHLLINYALGTTIALVASSAFWGPAVYARDGILAGDGLQTGYLESFLYVRELIYPTHFKTAGVSLLVMCGFASALAVYRRNWALVAYAAMVWGILAVQLHVMMPITVQIPMLEESALVWRLMFAFAFTTFGLVVATFGKMDYDMRPIMAIVVLNTGIFYSAQMADGIASPWRSASPATIVKEYSIPERTWGGLEFYPNYDELNDVCAVVQRATTTSIDYGSVRTGATTPPGYILIKAAPDSFVRWSSNGEAIAPFGKCGYQLVFGPFDFPAVLKSDEGALSTILHWRLITLAALFAVGFGFILRWLRYGLPPASNAVCRLQKARLGEQA